MIKYIIVLISICTGTRLMGQIKTKQIITMEDSLIQEQVTEYYTMKGKVYLEEYTDELGIYKAITYTAIDEFTVVDSIFEIAAMSTSVISTDLETAIITTHHLNTQGDEVKVETHYPFENTFHTDRYYFEYSPSNKKMLSGAYDDNSDSIILYTDSFFYNAGGLLSSKITYFTGSEFASTIEKYSYTQENKLSTIEIYKNPGMADEELEQISFTYTDGKLSSKQTQINDAVVYTETFEYNQRGDMVKHIMDSGEYQVTHLMTYTYYY